MSLVFSDICKCKMEKNVVKLLKPIFYKRYVDDMYVKRKRNKADTLSDALNSYHPNIKFTLEHSPKKFLDTQVVKDNNQIKIQAFVKKLFIQSIDPRKCCFDTRKIQLMVSSTEPRKIPQISNQRQLELKQSFWKLVFHTINNVNNVDKELLIPWWLFDERKTVAINLPFSEKNEHFSKNFARNFGRVKINIIWLTSKIKSLSKTKDKVKHLSCVISQRIYSCGHNYIGEAIRNAVTRVDEYEQPNGKSEPSKHMKNNPGCRFDWMIISRAPLHHLKQKIFEAYFIKQLNPSLNDQLDSKIIILFRHDVT